MNRVLLFLSAIGLMWLALGCARFETQSAADLFSEPTTRLESIAPEGDINPFNFFPDHPRVNADGHGYFDAVIVTVEDMLLIPAKSTAVLSAATGLFAMGVFQVTDSGYPPGYKETSWAVTVIRVPFMGLCAGTMGITLGAWYASLPFVHAFDWVAHDIPIWAIQWPMDWFSMSVESPPLEEAQQTRGNDPSKRPHIVPPVR